MTIWMGHFTRHHALCQFDADADRHIKTFVAQVHLAFIEMSVADHARITVYAILRVFYLTVKILTLLMNHLKKFSPLACGIVIPSVCIAIAALAWIIVIPAVLAAMASLVAGYHNRRGFLAFLSGIVLSIAASTAVAFVAILVMPHFAVTRAIYLVPMAAIIATFFAGLCYWMGCLSSRL